MGLRHWVGVRIGGEVIVEAGAGVGRRARGAARRRRCGHIQNGGSREIHLIPQSGRNDDSLEHPARPGPSHSP